VRKIVMGSGLGLVAAAIPVHGAALPLAAEPAGVSEAGQVRFADQGEQGVLIGLNQPGQTQYKQQGSASNAKVDPYAKMKAEAQLKVNGGNQLKLKNDSLKTGSQLKSGSQLKTGAALKVGDELKYGK
jgi:hypothetical protein